MKKFLFKIRMRIWVKFLSWLSLRLRPSDVELMLKHIVIARNLRHIDVNVDRPQVPGLPVSEIYFD